MPTGVKTTILKCYHDKAVSGPESIPPVGTRRDGARLTVDGQQRTAGPTDRAAPDVRRQIAVADRGGGDGPVGGQPVAGRRATGVRADAADVAEHERHRTEPLQTRPART